MSEKTSTDQIKILEMWNEFDDWSGRKKTMAKLIKTIPQQRPIKSKNAVMKRHYRIGNGGDYKNFHDFLDDWMSDPYYEHEKGHNYFALINGDTVEIRF